MIRSILMRRLAAGLLLLLLGVGPALADGAGLATTIYDEHGKALGSVTNPLNVLLPAGTGTSTTNQGTPNAGGAAAWFVQWANQSIAVSSLPSLPAGTNAIGAVSQGAAGAAPWLVSWANQSVAVSSLPSLPTGTNVIGAVTQSGGPWAVSAASLPLPTGAATAALQSATQGPVAPGTAAGASTMIGGVYTSTPPALSTGQQAAARLDASGNLQVTVTNPTAAAPSTVTANQGTAGASPWPVSEASGANVALGSTTDAPLTGIASATAASLQAEIKGLYNLLQAGTAKVQNAIWYSEAQAQTVAASATVTGTSRTNAASGAGQQFGYFTAEAASTVAGTLQIGNSNGEAAFSIAVPAGTVTTIKVPAFGSQFTSSFTAGGTGGTVTLYDGYTVN